MGGEEGLEGLVDEPTTGAPHPHPTGAQANGIVKPDDVEFVVPQKPAAVVPVLMLGEDSMLVD